MKTRIAILCLCMAGLAAHFIPRGGPVLEPGLTFAQISNPTTSSGAATWGLITGTLSSQTDLQSALDAKAALASPTFTGTPLSTTAAVDTNTTQVATTAYVVGQGYAKLASPTFTGTPAAPTAAVDTNTTQVATSAFVIGQGYAKLVSPSFTTPTLGVATATSINKMAITAPATSSTLAVADGKTLTASNSLTLAGTDSTTQTFPKVSSNLVGLLSATVGNTDTVSCPNNTTSNFATTYTIPASYLVANKILRVTLMFALTTSGTPPSMAFQMTIGGTTVFAATQAAATANLTGAPMSATFNIAGSAVASGSAAVFTGMASNVQGSGSSSFVPFRTLTTFTAQPVNLATNGTLVIQPQLFCSANTAGNSMTLQQFFVEALD